MGKLMITVMLAFAEYERDIIVERTQTGKAVARANGKRVDGRPKKFKPEQIAHALEMLEDGRSYTEVEKLTRYQQINTDSSGQKKEDGEGRGQLKPPPLLRFPRNHLFSFQYPYNMQVFDLFFSIMA